MPVLGRERGLNPESTESAFLKIMSSVPALVRFWFRFWLPIPAAPGVLEEEQLAAGR